ncbi:MAG: protein kinase [Polyangiaceae bacterium]|nr:protein kinase [Polyangiaceae bacterium]
MAVCARCRSVVEERGARYCPHCGDALPTVVPQVVRGDTLDFGWGRAVLGEIIGEGGMGIVHRGWLYYNPAGPKRDRAPHPVAIKLLSPLLQGSERAHRLFLREAAALERLHHPNIVRFYGLSQERRQLALVMELVEGEPLDRIIARTREQSLPGGLPCMPMVPAWHHLSQLLGALAATHALGIVHRDVKPSNVVCRSDGIAKLTDFGIARVPADEARQTGGLAPGTGAYMAPEQVMGEDPDPRTDLYSAAIVAFEMLTGATPFDRPGRNEIAVRTAQVEESPPPLTQLVPQAPQVADVLFARALAKDRVHRFPTALQMGEAFRAALGLPDTPGWSAQQRLARNARAVSQAGRRHTQSTPAVTRDEAARLRTDVMSGYRG